jgi:hypothetical protein
MCNFFKIVAIISVIIAVIIAVGEICNTETRIIKRTPDYIYVMEYSLYDLDSTLYKYKTEKTHIGTVSNKYKSSHFVGVVGKGGHYKTRYNVVIRFNNDEVRRTSRGLYDKYSIGDKVRVTESWYPCYKITIE